MLEVDDELELRRQLNRQIARLRALEDAAGIQADLMIRPRYRGTIAHQAAALDVHTPWVDGGKFITRRKRDDFSVAGHEERIGTDRKRACPLLGGRGKGCLQIAFYVGFQHNQSQIASARCVLYMFYLKVAPVRIWMHKQCNRVGFGHHRKQQLQTFWQQLDCVHAHAGGVAAWRPIFTGSKPAMKRSGMVWVAAFAVIAASKPPAMIRATSWRTRSATSSGSRSDRPPAHRYSIIRFRPST